LLGHVTGVQDQDLVDLFERGQVMRHQDGSAAALAMRRDRRQLGADFWRRQTPVPTPRQPTPARVR